jgi:glycosyltransferase involved in cell wall biosynthesis
LDELNIKQRVHIKGRLPMEEVRRAYATHDVFIYCSLRESLAAQFFESMAFGLPLIVFDLHGAKTFISSEVALKVPLGEPEESVMQIAKAIERMYRNPGERIMMGKKAYELAKNFTWSNRIGIINNYYRQLAEVRERVVTVPLSEHHYTVASDS